MLKNYESQGLFHIIKSQPWWNIALNHSTGRRDGSLCSILWKWVSGLLPPYHPVLTDWLLAPFSMQVGGHVRIYIYLHESEVPQTSLEELKECTLSFGSHWKYSILFLIKPQLECSYSFLSSSLLPLVSPAILRYWMASEQILEWIF